MKKNISVFIAVLLLLVLAPRDVAAGVTLDLGVKGGLSLAKFTYLETDWHDLNKPFIGGAFLAVNLSEHVAIQAEIYFRKMGYVADFYIGDDFYRQVWSHQYITVPILVKFRLNSIGKARPVVFGGLSGNVAMSETIREYANGTLVFEAFEPRPSSMNFASFVLGGGVEFTLAKLLLILDVRYEVLFPWQDVIFDRYNGFIFMAGIGF
jgi:hypothetical protein